MATFTASLSDYNSSNRITGTNARGVAAIPGYDAAGNITSDGVVAYLYDADGRVCAVENYAIPSMPTFTGYIYNAEGVRVSTGSLTSLSCNLSTNGFKLTEQYIVGQSGEELAMLDGNSNWQRANVYGAGKLLATYDSKGLHFHLADPLGTRRVQTNSSGLAELNCENLPFGDQQNCFTVPNPPSTADDATPLHFTGKERDTESGNDYFGARYYASSMGRFMSPDPVGDWAASIVDPQSWNQYAYVEGNPLTMVDPDGTCSEITAGINMSPSSKSGQDLIALAGKYGANVAFPYSGEDRATSVQNIGLAGAGANWAATATASEALNATLSDGGGGGVFSLGFSGGAQANVSAGVATVGQGAFQGNTAFYDPGLGLGQSLPAGASVYRGSGSISDLVNATSGGNTGTNIPGCGHDPSCAIRNSAALQAALTKAGPCNKPQVFTRNPFTVIPLVPLEMMPLGGYFFFFPWSSNDDLPNGKGTLTILPGFTPVDQ